MIDCAKAKFKLGQVVGTPGAREIEWAELNDALQRHINGDWGNVDADDKKANDDALVNGERLLSAYTTKSGTRFWIITERDRSVTTILLPEEY
jgi:hypothetical protein